MRPQRMYRAEGVIIHRRSYGEADRFLTIFTKHHGKIRVLAKGIRKITSKRAPHLDTLSIVSLVVYTGKSIDTVGECARLSKQFSFTSDLSKVSFSYYVCELVDALTALNIANENQYFMFLKTLQKIELARGRSELYQIVYEFALSLLISLGFLPGGSEVKSDGINQFIESVIERRLKTVRLLTSFAN
ncbi:MAG: DNA repair protein RecO [Patescibacteria group bacterium]